MEQIDMLDPNLSQDLTSEYMDVHKSQAEIKKLEQKIEGEKDFAHVEQYEQDMMLLNNLKT